MPVQPLMYTILRSAPLLIFSLLLISCAATPTDPQLEAADPQLSATDIIEAMGTGFNLGNTFDLRLHSTAFADIQPLIATYQLAGMRHIRIPVTWMEGFGGDVMADKDGRVDFTHQRFQDLKKVIDYALDRGLYVVLNTHHERSFKANYTGSSAQDQQFANLWSDIATYFQDYTPRLIFEPMNEPQDAFGSWGGSVGPNDPLGFARTRQIMRVGVEAIRSTGGGNMQRLIMIATNAHGNHLNIDEVYPDRSALPGEGTDAYLAIQVHTYDPWDFCGEDGQNSAFTGTGVLESSMRAVAAHGKTLGVPINYGEFGVGRRTRQSDRDTDVVRSFYRTIIEVARDEGMSTTVWDDRGWFGLVSGNSQSGYTFLHDIVPTMLAD